jgi:hypothetical protein
MTPTAFVRHRTPLLLAASGAAIAAVNGLDLPLTARRLRALAGGEPVLDLRPGFGPAEAYDLLSRLGAAGRTSYLTMLWTVDLLLPALFGAALWSALGAGALVRWRWLALAAAAFDYLENVALSALILSFPRPHPLLAILAGLLTAAKFSLYALAVACAAAGMWMARRASRSDGHEPGGRLT